MEERSAWRRRTLAAAVLIACLAVFFRGPLLDGLHHLHGDSYDGLIEVAILEHWYRVAAAGAPWAVTGYFHPYSATLGYNDTLFLPALPYVAARLIGADPFVAVTLAHVAMKAVGFVGMYVLLRRGLAVRTPLALAGAALFATANASLLHIYHAQLLSVGLLPWLGFLLIGLIGALGGDRPRHVLAHGIPFALLFGAGAFSSFYAIWFFSLFLLLWAPIAALTIGGARRRALLAALRRQWRPLLACAATGLVALVPLLLLYLPKVAEGAHHEWRNNIGYLPTATTVFDVGQGNLIWGSLAGALGYYMPGGEAAFGLPLGLMVAALLALLWARRDAAASRLVLPIGLAVLLMILLALRWPDGRSAWWYVHSYVPGGAAVRVVARLLLFALAGIVPVVFVFLDRAPRPGWLTALIVAGLLVEQVQLAAPQSLDADAQRAMLAAIGPPPAACRVIVVVSARPRGYPLLREAHDISLAWGDDGNTGDAPRYRHNVDAMLLSTYYGRPTINGYSSFNPPDWTFTDPDAADYRQRVAAYARRHGLRGLCGLDARLTPRWFRLG